MIRTLIVVAVTAVIVTSCKSPQEIDGKPVVLTGLDGKQYVKPDLSEKSRARLDSNAMVAEKNWQADPTEDNLIWYGRREAYRYNYEKAIEIFTDGLKRFPNSYKILRHRGHRYITIRQFDKAIADLQKASELMPSEPLEIEPDGLPNKMNIPLSTTQFNVWYHLALAHYLKGDFERALRAYIECQKVSDNDDLLTATTDWLYMTFMRLGRKDEANATLLVVRDSMNIIENDSYHKRLMMYKGQATPESLLTVENSDDKALALATQGYGVGNYYLVTGDTTRALETFKNVVAGEHFSAFGFIAAEADLVRFSDK